MVLNKGVKKCYGLLLVLFITFLFSFGVCSGDVSAVSDHYTTANVDFYSGQQYQATVNLPWIVNPGNHRFFLNNAYFNNSVYTGSKLAYIAGRVVMQVNPKTNVDFYVCGRDTQYSWGNASSSYCLGSISVVYTDTTRTKQEDIPVYFNEISSPLTYNLYFDFSKQLDASKEISFIQFRFYGSTGYDVISRTTNWNNTELMVLVEGRSSVSVYETPPSGMDIANDLLQQQVAQNQYQIDRELEAENNISSQQASDIPNSENQQTTNIISVLSGFLTALQSVQATNCTLTLPFPSFAGGSTTVNVCDGKQYAPTIVSVGSSLLLITLFIPLAYILLRMIYNEIRSWTNG